MRTMSECITVNTEAFVIVDTGAKWLIIKHRRKVYEVHGDEILTVLGSVIVPLTSLKHTNNK
jgi:hypothetical protein